MKWNYSMPAFAFRWHASPQHFERQQLNDPITHALASIIIPVL